MSLSSCPLPPLIVDGPILFAETSSKKPLLHRVVDTLRRSKSRQNTSLPAEGGAPAVLAVPPTYRQLAEKKSRSRPIGLVDLDVQFEAASTTFYPELSSSPSPPQSTTICDFSSSPPPPHLSPPVQPSTTRPVALPDKPWPYYAFGPSLTAFQQPDLNDPPLPCMEAVRRVPYSERLASGQAVVVPVESEGGRALVVKYGKSVSLAEAEGLVLVAARTTLPVPAVGLLLSPASCLRTGTDCDYPRRSLLSPQQRGRSRSTWSACRELPWTNAGRRSTLRGDLSTSFAALQRLRPPPGFVGALSEPFDSTLILPRTVREAGAAYPRPLNALDAVTWLSLSTSNFTSDSYPPDFPLPPPFPSSSAKPQLNLIHGDLATRNILAAEESGKVTGIIDWERCGWWWREVEAGCIDNDLRGPSTAEYKEAGLFLRSCLS